MRLSLVCCNHSPIRFFNWFASSCIWRLSPPAPQWHTRWEEWDWPRSFRWPSSSSPATSHCSLSAFSSCFRLSSSSACQSGDSVWLLASQSPSASPQPPPRPPCPWPWNGWRSSACRDGYASFVIPLGYSFNMCGSSVYISLAAVFAAQAAGIHLTLGQQVVMLGTLALASKGMAGVPACRFCDPVGDGEQRASSSGTHSDDFGRRYDHGHGKNSRKRPGKLCCQCGDRAIRG